MANWEIRAKEPFADPTRLTKWTVWSLVAVATLSSVALASDIVERDFLLQVQANQFASQDDLEAAEAANDLRQFLVGAIQLPVFLTSVVLSLKWIYRANLNAWRLGAEGMQFSPGWAIGYFFIPILNLWKPYQAFKEIWRASASPKHWRSVTSTALLPVWWALFLIAAYLGQADLNATVRTIELPTEGLPLFANALSLAGNIVEIPLDIAFIVLIRQIYRMQMEQSTGSSAMDIRDSATAAV
jgi:Domain of unknown function (DUF4328)